ncbi:MAG: hypothetical protein QM817_19115 [Archangium sp.]
MYPGPSGAQCAIHPASPAPAVCSRCGNFMCVVCSENGASTQCPACRQLTSTTFPLEATAGFDQIWGYAVERFKEEWVMLSVVVIVAGFVIAISGVFGNIISTIINTIIGIKPDPANPLGNLRDFAVSTGIAQAVNTVVQLPFQAIATMGMARVIIDVLYGRKADIGRMFKQMHLLSKAVVLQLLLFAIITLPVLILFGIFGFVAVKISGAGTDFDSHWIDRFMRSPAPFLIFGFSLVTIVLSIVLLPLQMLSMPELLVSECEPTEALRRAWMLGDGQRLRLFGYSLIAGLVTLVGLLVCCIGAIPAAAAGQMITLCLFLVIRKGSVLPPIADK